MLRWTLLLSVLMVVPLQTRAAKQADVPGYSFIQLTDNDRRDIEPRVSQNGLIVWAGNYGLPGSTSGEDDLEILLWDGLVTQQLTDNDLDDQRPVVNDSGDIAWQKLGNFLVPPSEISLLLGGVETALTSDEVADRYPDINNRGAVVWGTRNAENTGWELSVFDPLLGLPARRFPGRYAYRPHINNLDHIDFARGDGVYDLDQDLLTPLPPSEPLGYTAYRRTEINDLDHLAVEAAPFNPVLPDELYPDQEGPRDILFWDGVELTLLYSSPVWHGRADLNNAGVLVWEGFGGLPGSRSTPDDREVYVYNPELGVVIQLTDDASPDSWPTVTADGRIVWQGQERYPGASSTNSDPEIFIAVPDPDVDTDGLENGPDNCPWQPNPDQGDLGSIGTRGPDGVGDACQCGDVDGTGHVSEEDRFALRAWLVGAAPGLAAPELCEVIEDSGCSLADAAVIGRALQALEPGIDQVCAAARP
jgi:hypothetical protein